MSSRDEYHEYGSFSDGGKEQDGNDSDTRGRWKEFAPSPKKDTFPPPPNTTSVKEDYRYDNSRSGYLRPAAAYPTGPYGAAPVDARETHSFSIASMTLGIISLAMLVLSISTYGICSIPGIIIAVIGLILGVKGKHAIEAAPDSYKGLGFIKVGLITSGIGLGVNTAIVLIASIVILWLMIAILY